MAHRMVADALVILVGAVATVPFVVAIVQPAAQSAIYIQEHATIVRMKRLKMMKLTMAYMSIMPQYAPCVIVVDTNGLQ